MNIISDSELSKISGGEFAGEDSYYMCTYSLTQYHNSRFQVLKMRYNGDTPENVPYYNDQADFVDMYKSWISTYCPNEIAETFM